MKKSLVERMEEKMRAEGLANVAALEAARHNRKMAATGYWQQVPGRAGWYSPAAASELRSSMGCYRR